MLFYAPWAPAPEVNQSAAGTFVGVNTKAFNLRGPQENPFIANHFLLFLVGGSPKHTHLCGSLGVFIASRKSFPPILQQDTGRRARWDPPGMLAFGQALQR